MSDKDVELISRNTYRRMSRCKRARLIQSAKILIIWLFAITVNIAVIHALYAVLPHRLALRYFLIVVFTAVWVKQFVDITDNIKKSPRNGNSSRGH